MSRPRCLHSHEPVTTLTASGLHVRIAILALRVGPSLALSRATSRTPFRFRADRTGPRQPAHVRRTCHPCSLWVGQDLHVWPVSAETSPNTSAISMRSSPLKSKVVARFFFRLFFLIAPLVF